MNDDQNGTNYTQATCSDFLSIFWQADDLNQVVLSLDQTLSLVHQAISSGNHEKAQNLILKEFAHVAPYLTYLRYLNPHERALGPPPNMIRSYLPELHALYGRLAFNSRQYYCSRG